MSRLFLTFNLFMLFIIFGSVAIAESATHRFGIGANYGFNFDGDMYDDSQSLQLLYQYDRIQFNVGAKHYQLTDKSETIPDVSLLYSVHDGDLLDLKFGIGLEDTYPTVEYVAEYAISNNFGATIALNQTLNEDFGQNQREAVVGLSYYFYGNQSYDTSNDVEPRPNIVDAEPEKVPEVNIEKEVIKPVVKLKPEEDSKPTLPYIVQEGDWLYELRRKFGFDLDEIIEKNDIENPDLIYPGQVLNSP